MQRFHKPEDEKRMVVVLRPDECQSWLQAPAEQVGSFLRQYPADALRAELAPKPSAYRSRPPVSPASSLL